MCGPELDIVGEDKGFTTTYSIGQNPAGIGALPIDTSILLEGHQLDLTGRDVKGDRRAGIEFEFPPRPGRSIHLDNDQRPSRTRSTNGALESH